MGYSFPRDSSHLQVYLIIHNLPLILQPFRGLPNKAQGLLDSPLRGLLKLIQATWLHGNLEGDLRMPEVSTQPALDQEDFIHPSAHFTRRVNEKLDTIVLTLAVELAESVVEIEIVSEQVHYRFEACQPSDYRKTNKPSNGVEREVDRIG